MKKSFGSIEWMLQIASFTHLLVASCTACGQPLSQTPSTRIRQFDPPYMSVSVWCEMEEFNFRIRLVVCGLPPALNVRFAKRRAESAFFRVEKRHLLQIGDPM